MNRELRKDLGSFHSNRGSVRVAIISEEVPIQAERNATVYVTIPVCLELTGNGGPIQILVEDLDGFVGMLGGSAREVRRARFAAMMDLDKLGVKLSGR